MRTLLRLTIIATAITALGAAPPVTHAAVYWIGASGSDATIGRSAPDGSAVDEQLYVFGPEAAVVPVLHSDLAAADGDLYWRDSANGITRAAADGSGATQIVSDDDMRAALGDGTPDPGASTSQAVAADGAHVFFTAAQTLYTGEGQALLRADTDGSHLTVLVPYGLDPFTQLAVANGHVYYYGRFLAVDGGSCGTTVCRVGTDGSTVEPAGVPAFDAISDTTAYWFRGQALGHGPDTIARAPIAGGASDNPWLSFAAGSRPLTLTSFWAAASSSDLYWSTARFPDAPYYAIGHVLRDGQALDPVLVRSCGQIDAVAVDGSPTPAATPRGSCRLTTQTSGAGSVSRSLDLSGYAYGTPVTLTAAPAPGNVFTGWADPEGECTGSARSCVVHTRTAARTVTATFAPTPTHRLDVGTTGEVSVTSSPAGIKCGNTCSHRYVDGTEVTLRATAAPGWHLRNAQAWGGDCAGVGTGAPSTCTLIMDADRTATATAVPDQPVTVHIVGADGRVVASGGAPRIDCDREGGTTSGTCSVVLTPSHLSQIDLKAKPTSHTTFVTWSPEANTSNHWAGCFLLTGLPQFAQHCQVLTYLDYPVDVTARFAENPPASHELDVRTAGPGTVTSTPPGISCGNTCSHRYDDGTEVQLQEHPTPGWSFISWTGDCSGDAKTCDVAMTADRTVTATFARTDVNYALDVRTFGSGAGTVTSTPPAIDCGTTCWQEYLAGSTVELAAHPDAQSMFGTWSGCTTVTATDACEVTLNGDTTVTARFDANPPPNQPPVANAVATLLHDDRFRLDGSASVDPDGRIVSYRWSTGGQRIARGERPVERFQDPRRIALTVVDNDGASDTTHVRVRPRERPPAHISLPAVYFHFDRATLRPVARRLLGRVRRVVRDARALGVSGYCRPKPGTGSNPGVKPRCRYLARQRARHVKRALLRPLKPRHRPRHVRARGCGISRRFARPARDRRVVITVVGARHGLKHGGRG
jgi:outer membrane protein OmpA-like peptidoglycan-associated protein